MSSGNRKHHSFDERRVIVISLYELLYNSFKYIMLHYMGKDIIEKNTKSFITNYHED